MAELHSQKLISADGNDVRIRVVFHDIVQKDGKTFTTERVVSFKRSGITRHELASGLDPASADRLTLRIYFADHGFHEWVGFGETAPIISMIVDLIEWKS